MKKRMIIMLVLLGILFGGISIIKLREGIEQARLFAAQENPIFTVSTMKVGHASWQTQLKAVGSTDSVLGIDVTAQLAGMVQKVYFNSGDVVKAGTILVQQNADPDIAQLHALEANTELAKITYRRDKAQYAVRAVSKQQLDTDVQNLKSLRAQVAQQAAIVDKLTIKAPFSGRLGITDVNPGQYLNPGNKIVTLQTLDPIYVDFYLPQQTLADLKVGQKVSVTTDTFKDQIFSGKITTINPIVDTNTRNVEVEATLANPKNALIPGMFVLTTVTAGMPKQYLTVPQTAITFNSYGDIVYLVKETGKDEKGHPTLIATQSFVKTGETRGDQITILEGLKAGDVIVTSGQLKLKNGSRIAINNTIEPPNNPAPLVSNEHEG